MRAIGAVLVVVAASLAVAAPLAIQRGNAKRNPSEIYPFKGNCSGCINEGNGTYCTVGDSSPEGTCWLPGVCSQWCGYGRCVSIAFNCPSPGPRPHSVPQYDGNCPGCVESSDYYCNSAETCWNDARACHDACSVWGEPCVQYGSGCQ